MKSFIFEYLKVDCIESYLKAEDRATKKTPERGHKKEGNSLLSPIFHDNTHQVASKTFP